MASRKGWMGRVLIGAVAALLLIALGAVPSFGASKKYVLDVKPNLVVGGSSTDFTVTITNTTPGNSTINSFSISVPSSFSNVSAQILPQPDSTNPNSSGTVSPPVGSVIKVQNIDSLKTNQFLRVKVTATPPVTPCDVGYQWNAIAYAGNSLAGDQFANQGAVSARTTTVGCAGIRFVDGHTPQDAVLNTKITGTDLDPTGPDVQVEYVVGGVRQNLNTGTVTLQYGTKPASPLVPGTLSPSPTTATFSGGVATFSSLSITDTAPFDAGGAYSLVATYSSFTTESPLFTIFDALLCGGGGSYTEDSQSESDAGQFQIASETDGCFGIIVNNFSGGTGTQNVDEWSAIKSVAGGTFIQGTFAINWDLGDGTGPVPWTQVTWDGPGGAYHDVQRCVAGQTGDARFPGTEQICLISSTLVQVGTHWEQAEQFAFNTDLGGRKP